jgi:hypothetical protein
MFSREKHSPHVKRHEEINIPPRVASRKNAHVPFRTGTGRLTRAPKITIRKQRGTFCERAEHIRAPSGHAEGCTTRAPLERRDPAASPRPSAIQPVCRSASGCDANVPSFPATRPPFRLVHQPVACSRVVQTEDDHRRHHWLKFPIDSVIFRKICQFPVSRAFPDVCR